MLQLRWKVHRVGEDEAEWVNLVVEMKVHQQLLNEQQKEVAGVGERAEIPETESSERRID